MHLAGAGLSNGMAASVERVISTLTCANYETSGTMLAMAESTPTKMSDSEAIIDLAVSKMAAAIGRESSTSLGSRAGLVGCNPGKPGMGMGWRMYWDTALPSCSL